MRIISGAHKGKKITASHNLPVRPTTDFAKESLFNILNNYFYFEGVNVLDLCAGTGNISYEFAARGAISVISVDSNIRCVQFMEKTAKEMNFKNMKIVKTDIIYFLHKCRQKFNIIFADPPYSWDKFETIPDLVFKNELLSTDGFLVIEHSGNISFEEHPKFYQHRTYGRVNFSIFAENL